MVNQKDTIEQNRADTEDLFSEIKKEKNKKKEIGYKLNDTLYDDDEEDEDESSSPFRFASK